MNTKIAESILISLFFFCFSCQVHHSGVNSEKISGKTESYITPYILPEDSLLYGFNLFMEQPDESELYPTKEVTLDFTAYDTYHVEATDPKLFAADNTEFIDLSLIGEDYSLPIKNPRIVSRYAGKRVNHTGIDLTSKKRDPIYATFDGVVRVARHSDTYGNVIVIRHYNGLETVYSHNTENMVEVGEEVLAGQQIAVSGSTGRASGDHLHFEVRINGQHFNPELLFDFRAQKLREKALFCFKSKNRIKVSLVDPFPYYLSDSKQASKGFTLPDYLVQALKAG